MRYLISILNPYRIFIFLAGLLCLIYIIIFVPVIQGDAGHYISLGQDIAEHSKEAELGNRSPLYTWMLAVLIRIAGVESLTDLVMTIQFILVFVSSLLIYRIAYFLTKRQILSFLTGIFYLVNISTINYGYLILTETLTLLLLILATWLIIKYYRKSNSILLVLSGFVFSFLVLARYNTFLIPVFVIFALIINDIINKSNDNFYKPLIKKIFLFSSPLIIVLLMWSYHNYVKNGYFFLFSLEKSGTMISKNGIYAAIDSDTNVDEEFQPYKEIVLDVQNEFLDGFEERTKKGSLINLLPSERLIIYNNGYAIRMRSYKEFVEQIGYNVDILARNEIKRFEKNVVNKNRSDIFKVRFFSLLTGFRASSSSLGIDNKNKNLDALPAYIFIIYKLIVIILTLIAYTYMLYQLVRIVLRKASSLNFELLLIMLTAYFPAVNFIFALSNDANRFKYPSEPFIILFALLGISGGFKYFKNKYINKKYIRIILF